MKYTCAKEALISDISQALARRCSRKDHSWTLGNIIERRTVTCTQIEGVQTKSSVSVLSFSVSNVVISCHDISGAFIASKSNDLLIKLKSILFEVDPFSADSCQFHLEASHAQVILGVDLVVHCILF